MRNNDNSDAFVMNIMLIQLTAFELNLFDSNFDC